MKLLRVGNKGEEIVAALDDNNKIRDLSSQIKDLIPETINFFNLICEVLVTFKGNYLN